MLVCHLNKHTKGISIEGGLYIISTRSIFKYIMVNHLYHGKYCGKTENTIHYHHNSMALFCKGKNY